MGKGSPLREHAAKLLEAALDRQATAWIITTPSGTVLHCSKHDGWSLEIVSDANEPPHAGPRNAVAASDIVGPASGSPDTLVGRLEEHGWSKAEAAQSLRALEADVQAYRGALGYSVEARFSDRLQNGELPRNGIAEALQSELAKVRKDAIPKIYQACARHRHLPLWIQSAPTFIPIPVCPHCERDSALSQESAGKEK